MLIVLPEEERAVIRCEGHCVVNVESEDVKTGYYDDIKEL